MAAALKKRVQPPTPQANGRGKGKGQPVSRPKIHELSLAQIQDDTDLQPRGHMDMDVMREYTAAWLEGSDFPPIVVYFDGETYWLADGFYRTRSARSARLPSIKAWVYEGGKREALLYAVGANEEHGLRRTNDDRKKAVMIMLNDDEWCLWSDSEIGKACKVSGGLVGNIRKNSPGLKGHTARTRIASDGRIQTTPEQELPEGVDHRTFKRPPLLMNRSEIVDKYERRLYRHLQKSDKELKRSVEYKFGTVEMASPTTIYAIVLITDRHGLYSVAGRMLVARAAMNSKANIVIIGHFPRSVAGVVQILADDFGIQCLTPEQILAS